MKVVVNALQYKKNSSGIGVQIRGLFSAFAALSEQPCEIVLSADSPELPVPEGGNVRVVRAPCRYGQSLRRMRYQSFGLSRRLKGAMLLTVDSKIPLFPPKSCCVVPLISDLALFRLRGIYPRSRALWWKFQYRLLRRRAFRWLAVSEFTKRDIAQLFHIPPERIDVVPNACAEHFRRVGDPAALAAVREKYGLPERYVLFIGNFNPRKNLRRIIEAFDLAKTRADLPHKLAICGGTGWRFDPEKALEGVAHREDVLFCVYIADEDMPALYSAADLFVFATLYEGFGIPILEAQNCGTPVLAGSVTAMPEAGGEGALYADPLNVEEIAAGMLRILQSEEEAARLRAAGYRNAARFSWENSARLLQQAVTRAREEWEVR